MLMCADMCLTSQAALDHLSARGALVVASAGNDGVDTDATPHYPSSLPDDIIISVGAATRQNALWCAALPPSLQMASLNGLELTLRLVQNSHSTPEQWPERSAGTWLASVSMNEP